MNNIIIQESGSNQQYSKQYLQNLMEYFGQFKQDSSDIYNYYDNTIMIEGKKEKNTKTGISNKNTNEFTENNIDCYEDEDIKDGEIDDIKNTEVNNPLDQFLYQDLTSDIN